MKCRVEGCDRVPWMGRRLCAPHLKMLPPDLQQKIRRNVNGKMQSTELPALLDAAIQFIAAKEAENQVAAQVHVFRTHMATVHAIVAGIRTVDMRAVRDQLAASSESLLKVEPDVHAERKPHIDRDLAFLEFFAAARERLGEIIEAHPVPTKEDPTLVENAPQEPPTELFREMKRAEQEQRGEATE